MRAAGDSTASDVEQAPEDSATDCGNDVPPDVGLSRHGGNLP